MTGFFFSILDFFLPRFCPCCKLKIDVDTKFICKSCLSLIDEVKPEFISKEFEKKFSENNLITDFYSAFYFSASSPIQDLIHNLKYSQNFKLGIFLGETALKKSKSIIEDWQIDLIVPIPLHPTKKAERGFNQSYYIAKGMSDTLNVKVATSVVKRKRFTSSQTGYNFEDRTLNMKDVFVVQNKKAIENKNILLVDDVITTGATISSCAKVLKEKKAKNIFAFSVAIPPVTTFCQEQIHQE